MRTTLAQAKDPSSGIARAINIAACDSRFVDILNNAQQRLSEMGRWWGTYRRLYTCFTAQCITWPREVATVEGLTMCREGVPLMNEWYEFGEAVKGPDANQSACNPRWLMDRPNACQFTDLASSAKFRIYPTVAADAGVKIVLQGFDTNVQPIRTLVGSNYIDGEQVTLASPFATSTFEFYPPGLTGVIKPVTKGRLNVFALDTVSGVETKVAVWEASETNPTYRRSWMTNLPQCGDTPGCGGAGNGCNPTPLPSCSGILAEAIVRLEFVPALVDTDWLFISNLQAVKCGMKAQEKEDRNQYQEAEIEWARAKRILRNELEKYSPTDRVIVNAQPHGTARPSRVFGGFI